MIRLSSVAVGLGASLFLAGQAFAVTVTNQDAKEHTLTIDRGVQEDQQKIAAGASAQVQCPDRCEFRVLGMGYGRPAASGEKLVIGQGGMIMFPSEATKASADAAKGAK